ncbi:MAG: DUF302 domain-containing protein [Betaproteobacteria bacterium]|nr:DUF302 domain-containing protein [Betaproteobacteria bacterium]
MKRTLLLFLALACSTLAQAAPAVYQTSAKTPLAKATKAVTGKLEDAGYAVVDELTISENLKRMAQKWGPDYNRNKLEGITSLVFCNGWYVNQVSNLDPSLLGLCPLHVTLTHKAGVTTVLFNRPTALAAGSPAEKVLKEAESEVIQAIEAALNGK